MSIGYVENIPMQINECLNLVSIPGVMPWLINVKSLAIFNGFWLLSTNWERVYCSNGALKWARQYLASV